jgi:RNA polymerase sigma factor (sigma-70 family)
VLRDTLLDSRETPLSGPPVSDAARSASESAEARLERLLRDYGGALARMCAAYERDPVERDDLWQEMAFALWRALPGFRGDCSEKTFVYRIARNRALTHRFRHRLATSPLSDAEKLPDPGAATDAAAERESERAQLLGTVRRLPEGLKSAVVLRLEGLDDEEIAEVLGITLNNVAVRLTRARDALRRLVQSTERIED